MDKNEKEKSGTNCSYSIALSLVLGKYYLLNPGIFLRNVLVECGGPQLTALGSLFCAPKFLDYVSWCTFLFPYLSLLYAVPNIPLDSGHACNSGKFPSTSCSISFLYSLFFPWSSHWMWVKIISLYSRCSSTALPNLSPSVCVLTQVIFFQKHVLINTF